MIPADLDARVLASLKAGHANARAISEAEGINSTAAKNSLERLESRGQVIRRGSQWKVLG
jgi:predicted ArsR family transcriptional regulator